VHGLDADLEEADAERARQRRRVLEGVAGAVARGHGHAQDGLGPQRLGGEAGGQGAVDAAGETQHRAPETALPGVVAQAQHQRPADLVRLLLRSPWRRRACPRPSRLQLERRRRAVEADDEQRLLEERRPRQHRAVGAEERRGAVEQQGVVPAHLVHVGHRSAVAAGRGGEHPLPQRWLPHGVGRGREVHHQRGPAGDELANWVALVARALPEALVVPDVLADGEPEPEPEALGRGSGAPRGGQEVARLVEDVVGRQEGLPAHRGHATSLDERHGVVEPGGRSPGGPLREAHREGHAPGPGGRLRQVAERRLAAVEELGEIEEVARRVAAERELREHHQRRPGGARALYPVADLGCVPVEVPDGGVDLGEGDPAGRHGRAMLPSRCGPAGTGSPNSEASRRSWSRRWLTRV
jgi:hypothetical protein